VLTVVLFSIAGAAAQLVDGTLGMGFGITSATLLLLFGVAPAAASAGTHAAKLGTTFVSGYSHWRVGNVDRRVVVLIAVPGTIAAFLGAVVLSGISLTAARTSMSGLLFCFGLLIVLRFALGISVIPRPRTGNSGRWLAPIGAVAGFVDATGGGGWGPVATPSLLTVTRHEPRRVVGTVNAAEFFVALGASIGFLTGSARNEIPWLAVLGLLIGGVIMAPIAARLAGRLPHAPMGTLVGTLVLVTNWLILGPALGLPVSVDWVVGISLTAGGLILAWRAWRVPPPDSRRRSAASRSH